MANQRDPNKQRISIWIDKKQLLQIDAEAQRLGRTRSDIVLKAIREHLRIDPVPASAAQIDEVKTALVELAQQQRELPRLIQKTVPALPRPGRKLSLAERITGRAKK